MMKHVTPHADLPSQHAMHSSNAMPARNMTGVFLGTVNPNDAEKSKGIPPLARARGNPHRPKTPVEQRRYYTSCSPVHTSLYGDSAAYLVGCAPHVIPLMPAMPRSRYPLISPQRMVELFRVKEERRGFLGGQLKKAVADGQGPTSPTSGDPSPASSNPHPAQPQAVLNLSQLTPDELAIWEITKHGGPVNNGLSRQEYAQLRCEEELARMHPPSTQSPTRIAHEVHRIAMDRRELMGLVECYRKVCKGNINSLHSLLPARTASQGRSSSGNHYTGFAVKSYRNPNRTAITADFPDTVRPRTVMGTAAAAYVPSPYFFKVYDPPTGLQHTPQPGYNHQPDNGVDFPMPTSPQFDTNDTNLDIERYPAPFMIQVPLNPSEEVAQMNALLSSECTPNPAKVTVA